MNRFLPHRKKKFDGSKITIKMLKTFKYNNLFQIIQIKQIIVNNLGQEMNALKMFKMKIINKIINITTLK